jgi:predicted protein tyrosine phosphatase
MTAVNAPWLDGGWRDVVIVEEILCRRRLSGRGSSRAQLMAEKCCDVPAAVQYAENQHISALNAVEDDVLAYRETA